MSDKQKRFVEEYLIDGNATRAAIAAGYSERTARQAGARLLTKVNIQKAIASAKAARSERVQVTQDYVISRLVIEAEREGDGSSHSARVSALEKLGKHLGMFTDRVIHEGAVPIEIIDFSSE